MEGRSIIVFRNLKWRNLLSTGNNWTEIDFLKSNTTLIVGHNGSGKSTMLDALSFALFGRAHRNISKPQLVNSINNKNCVVEVTFTALGSDFRIVRGIKPSIFEIWRGDTMINQDSHAKEYQKILEQNILKLNHKSFHQIVVLGSSSFVPFMQLSAQHRREVIEDLLDINVFSKMNSLLKEKSASLKEQIKDTTHYIEMNKAKTDAQRKYLRDVKALKKGQREEKKALIEEYHQEIKKLIINNQKLSECIDSSLPSATAARDAAEQRFKSLETYKMKFDTDIRKIVKDVKFFEENDTCPSCSQSITEQTRHSHIEEGKQQAKQLRSAIKQAAEALQKASDAVKVNDVVIEECRRWQSDMHANNQSINQFQAAIDRVQKELDTLSDDADVLGAEQQLQQLVIDSNSLIEQRLLLNEQYTYNNVMSEMLKDTGIKTKIVKQYIPVINKLCNNYLQILDFFVHFNLDEAFQETIRSRFRDNFSYDSFSEGEKQRIDLALLFTWRQIAKMKNSVATNLLILDETFDSSLDHDGVDNLMKIIYSLGDDTNIFVISHKGELLEGRFANKIEMIKEKNFSKIKGN